MKNNRFLENKFFTSDQEHAIMIWPIGTRVPLNIMIHELRRKTT